jgi:hypothetical protein
MAHAAARGRGPRTIALSRTLLKGINPMRYFHHVITEPSLLLLVLMVGGLAASMVYLFLSSITY